MDHAIDSSVVEVDLAGLWNCTILSYQLSFTQKDCRKTHVEDQTYVKGFFEENVQVGIVVQWGLVQLED